MPAPWPCQSPTSPSMRKVPQWTSGSAPCSREVSSLGPAPACNVGSTVEHAQRWVALCLLGLVAGVVVSHADIDGAIAVGNTIVVKDQVCSLCMHELVSKKVNQRASCGVATTCCTEGYGVALTWWAQTQVEWDRYGRLHTPDTASVDNH